MQNQSIVYCENVRDHSLWTLACVIRIIHSFHSIFDLFKTSLHTFIHVQIRVLCLQLKL